MRKRMKKLLSILKSIIVRQRFVTTTESLRVYVSELLMIMYSTVRILPESFI